MSWRCLTFVVACRALILTEGHDKRRKPMVECFCYTKFISSPFIYLFSTVIPIISLSFASLYRDDIVVAIEINACDTCHSVDKLMGF